METIYIHGLEDLTLLKCQYYPKGSTDSVKSLSKSQWHFLEIEKPILKFIQYLKDPA